MTPLLEFGRPGPAAHDWLAKQVAELKQGDPFRLVTVIVPNLYAGRQASWTLARRGGYVNVRPVRLAELALQLAGPGLRRDALLTDVLEASAIRKAAGLQPGLASVAQHQALHGALAVLFRELRRREIDVGQLDRDQLSAAGQAALDAYADYSRLLAGYVDATDVREQAWRWLADAAVLPPELAACGGLLLFLPGRLDPIDARLLAAAARWVPLRALFARFDDPLGLAGERPLADAQLLAAAIGCPPPAAAGERPLVDVDLPPAALDCPPPAAGDCSTAHGSLGVLALPANVRVVRAPDAAEECREIVRRVAADLDAGVPLYRTAILYRQSDPYAALVRDQLGLAGMPWSALDGRAISDSRPGRGLLQALRLPERRFERQAVLQWVQDTRLHANGTGPTASAWERLGREAAVRRDPAEWSSRLRGYAERLAAGSSTEESSATYWASQARAIAQVVEDLSATLAVAPPDGSSWSAFVAWADGIRRRFTGEQEQWPADEQPFAEDVRLLLAGLAQADVIEHTTSLAVFTTALEEALRGRARPTGRLGEGVLVGPVQAATGLSFERVYLLGLNEGRFPPAPAAEPFLSIDATDPLHRGAERQAFLSALAAAGDQGQVTVSCADASGDRAAFPSRWLLEIAGVLEGRRLDTSAFRRLDPAKRPWLRVIRSPQDGAAAAVAPADLDDRRVGEAVRWQQAGGLLRQHPVAQRTDLPVAAGLRLAALRRSAELTMFDGNVAAIAQASDAVGHVFDADSAISASAVQTWAACPFRYFLRTVLKVRPTSLPEDRWTIDPAAKGTLVHDVLNRFFTQLQEQGGPRPGAGYREADAALLRQVAAAAFAEAEDLGLTGHPLTWNVTREAILADLQTFLVEDAAWRAEHQLQPAHFEQAFGRPDAGSWEAAIIDLDAGSLRFHGYIDRVDIDPARKRAFLFDYKTGSSFSYEQLESDPVAAGTQVQLALYTEAVRQHLGANFSVGGAYWFISSRGSFQRIGLPEDARVVDDRLRTVLNVITNGVRSGLFPQVPGDEDEHYNTFDNCRYCDYERICPTARDELWAHKKASPACSDYHLLQPDGAGS